MCSVKIPGMSCVSGRFVDGTGIVETHRWRFNIWYYEKQKGGNKSPLANNIIVSQRGVILINLNLLL
jgi:hypothetical protein